MKTRKNYLCSLRIYVLLQLCQEQRKLNLPEGLSVLFKIHQLHRLKQFRSRKCESFSGKSNAKVQLDRLWSKRNTKYGFKYVSWRYPGYVVTVEFRFSPALSCYFLFNVQTRETCFSLTRESFCSFRLSFLKQGTSPKITPLI